MFIVLEMQKLDENTLAILPVNTYETLAAADNKYYTILASAAISNVWKHSAIMMNEDGSPIKFQCYTHIPDTAPEPEVEE